MGTPVQDEQVTEDKKRKWTAFNMSLWIGAFLICSGYVLGIAFIWNTTVLEHPRMERLGWWSQTIAAVVAILAAFFVAVQVADLKRSSRTSAFEATASRMQDVARILLAHPKLNQMLRQGKLTAESELLAEMLLDNMDTELLRQEKLPDQWEDSLPTLKVWYRDLFREMPGLRKILDKRGTWYRIELRELRREACPDD